MKRRVIFVDDEANLLAGLRRMLRHKRDEWEMEFAEGAQAGLALMAAQPFDVVVSDMRMPGMDGAQFLAAVQKTYPRTARIVLSGHADQAMIISAVGPTQQFLAKPCEVDVLIGVIDRVLALHNVVTDEGLREALGGVQSLPKPPHVHQQITTLVANPDYKIEDIAAVIEGDIATSAEVLRLVNSAFFGLPSRVDTVGRAVGLLGLETIEGLAVAGAVFGAGGSPPPGIDPIEMSDRGLRAGVLARKCATAEGWTREAVGDAYFAALLSEIALPVLASLRPTEWAALREVSAEDLWAEHAAQVAAFGCGVAEASAYLLGLWGFSEEVVQAVGGQPARYDDQGTPAALLLTTVRQVTRFGRPAQVPAEGGWLDADRLERWAQIDEAFAAPAVTG